jgi:sirohydrochlorin ferrochelatase
MRWFVFIPSLLAAVKGDVQFACDPISAAGRHVDVTDVVHTRRRWVRDLEKFRLVELEEIAQNGLISFKEFNKLLNEMTMYNS